MCCGTGLQVAAYIGHLIKTGILFPKNELQHYHLLPPLNKNYPVKNLEETVLHNTVQNRFLGFNCQKCIVKPAPACIKNILILMRHYTLKDSPVQNWQGCEGSFPQHHFY